MRLIAVRLGRIGQTFRERCFARITLAKLVAVMPDDDKPARLFPVEVTVNGVRVTVTLMLKPGVAVTVAETTTTTKPETPNSETSDGQLT